MRSSAFFCSMFFSSIVLSIVLLGDKSFRKDFLAQWAVTRLASVNNRPSSRSHATELRPCRRLRQLKHEWSALALEIRITNLNQIFAAANGFQLAIAQDVVFLKTLQRKVG